MQIAKVDPCEGPAFIWDWVALSSTPNKTLQGDTTYYISGYVYLSGTARIEGGAVLKFTNTTTAAINIGGSLVCQTGAYRPAILTAKDDDSIGALIPGSSGAPMGKYGNGLVFWSSGATLSYLRFSRANSAVTLSYMEGQISMTNLQFINCTYPIDSSAEDLNTIIVNNCLFSSATYGIKGGRDLIVIGQQLTAHNINTLAWSQNQGDSYAYLTNCVLASVTSLGHAFTLLGEHNGFYSSPQFGSGIVPETQLPFQTVGAGSYYLRTDSPFHGVGSPTLPDSLLNNLKTKSTYPPIVFPRLMEVIGELRLFPQVPRYVTGYPDLGYHYDVLDYTVAAMLVEGGTVTVQPGTAVGVRQEFAPELWWPWWYTHQGFQLRNGASFVSHGTANRPNTFVATKLVQEIPDSDFAQYRIDFDVPVDTTLFASAFEPDSEGSPPPSLDLRFSNLYAAGPDSYHFMSGYSWDLDWESSLVSCAYWKLRDCSLGGGSILLGTPVWWSDWDYVWGDGSAEWVNNLQPL